MGATQSVRPRRSLQPPDPAFNHDGRPSGPQRLTEQTLWAHGVALVARRLIDDFIDLPRRQFVYQQSSLNILGDRLSRFPLGVDTGASYPTISEATASRLVVDYRVANNAQAASPPATAADLPVLTLVDGLTRYMRFHTAHANQVLFPAALLDQVRQEDETSTTASTSTGPPPLV